MRGKGMTRKDAIDLLDNLTGMVEDNHNSDYDTALKMGIKALEQEDAIEALRNLRAEIQDRAYNTPYTNQLSVDAHNVDIDIINKHINKLKGENE